MGLQFLLIVQIFFLFGFQLPAFLFDRIRVLQDGFIDIRLGLDDLRDLRLDPGDLLRQVLNDRRL